MIICHCTGITDADLRAAVDWMRAADPETVITPGKIYHALGRRPDCGGCLPLLMDTLAKCDNYGIPVTLRGMARGRSQNQESFRHEGRRQGHRLSQQGASQ